MVPTALRLSISRLIHASLLGMLHHTSPDDDQLDPDNQHIGQHCDES